MQRRHRISKFDHLSGILKKISLNFAPKFGSDRIKLINNWNNIIGDEFAKYSYPYKITKAKVGDTLTIVVNNAPAASMISFTQNLLIEKINIYFGYKLIHSIKIIIKQV